VKVISGELKTLKGIVIEIIGDQAKIQPNEIKFPLQLEIKQLSKDFSEGDKIVVISGKYTGERGLVTKIEGDMAFFLSEIQK
jgi:transcription elongation factor